MTGTRAQFACPVSWCAGYVWDHGGDGLSGPGDWMHSSESIPLAGTLWAVRGAVGTGPEFWSVYVGGDEAAVGTGVFDAAQLALTLECAAQRLREVALPPVIVAGG